MTDTFTGRFVLEEESVRRPTSDRNRPVVTAPPPAKACGVSRSHTSLRASPRGYLDRCKAQNIFWHTPGANRRWFAYSKYDFPDTKTTIARRPGREGSLSCVHREDVLRYSDQSRKSPTWVGDPRPGIVRPATRTRGAIETHVLAAYVSDYSLFKEHTGEHRAMNHRPRSLRNACNRLSQMQS